MTRHAIPLAAIALAALFCGCASTKTGAFTSSSDYDTVFAACRQAAVESGFGVTSASKEDGFISAQMAVVQGQGTAVVMSIQVTREPGSSRVEVSIVPPPGTAGDIQAYLDKFAAALKRRVPDVQLGSGSRENNGEHL